MFQADVSSKFFASLFNSMSPANVLSIAYALRVKVLHRWAKKIKTQKIELTCLKLKIVNEAAEGSKVLTKLIIYLN
jgi:hypothetical protein